MGESKRKKFIDLANKGGSRRDFVKLANELGLTDKEEPAKKKKKNLFTESFKKAKDLNLSGKEKTKVFKRLHGLRVGGGKLTGGTGEPDIQGDPLTGEGLLIEPKMSGRDKKRSGGLVKKGKPKLCKKGWK